MENTKKQFTLNDLKTKAPDLEDFLRKELDKYDKPLYNNTPLSENRPPSKKKINAST